jgi:hypothetical protein
MVLMRNFHPKVAFAVEPWAYHWTYTHRFIVRPETSTFLVNLVRQHFGHRQIMACVLGYGASLHKCVHESRKEEVVSTFAPLLPHALRQLTHGEYVNSHTTELERPTTIVVSDEEPSNSQPGDTTFDLLAFHTVEALHEFLSENVAETYKRYEVFNTLSVCESVSQVMLSCPDNGHVQRLGIEILCILASNGIDTALFGSLAARALVTAIIGAAQDKDLHLRFALTVKYLARDSSEHRHTLVTNGAHKWLFIILQCQWQDVTVHALEATANLCIDEDLARAIGAAGLCEAVLRTLENHNSEPKVCFCWRGSRSPLLSNFTFVCTYTGLARRLPRTRAHVPRA